jgi:uncharacterized membrane protein
VSPASREGAIRRQLRGERGSVLVFTTAMLAFLLVFLGLSIDLAHYMVVRAELQTSLDAAALAGAWKVGSERLAAQPTSPVAPHDVNFGDIMTDAATFANLNGLHGLTGGGGVVVLESGEIEVGVWTMASRSFAGSGDGATVNAVRVQKSVVVQTMFLRLVGLNALQVGSTAAAYAEPNCDTIVPPPTPPCTLDNANLFRTRLAQ